MDYTKGEWKEHGAFVETDKTPICSTCNVNNLPLQEQIGNARLIAATPEMYEALKLYQSHQQGTSGHYCWQCAEAINKALAKAEGE